MEGGEEEEVEGKWIGSDGEGSVVVVVLWLWWWWRWWPFGGIVVP